MKNKFIVCLKRKIWKQMLPFRLLMDSKVTFRFSTAFIQSIGDRKGHVNLHRIEFIREVK